MSDSNSNSNGDPNCDDDEQVVGTSSQRDSVAVLIEYLTDETSDSDATASESQESIEIPMIDLSHELPIGMGIPFDMDVEENVDIPDQIGLLDQANYLPNEVEGAVSSSRNRISLAAIAASFDIEMPSDNDYQSDGESHGEAEGQLKNDQGGDGRSMMQTAANGTVSSAADSTTPGPDDDEENGRRENPNIVCRYSLDYTRSNNVTATQTLASASATTSHAGSIRAPLIPAGMSRNAAGTLAYESEHYKWCNASQEWLPKQEPSKVPGSNNSNAANNGGVATANVEQAAADVNPEADCTGAVEAAAEVETVDAGGTAAATESAAAVSTIMSGADATVHAISEWEVKNNGLQEPGTDTAGGNTPETSNASGGSGIAGVTYSIDEDGQRIYTDKDGAVYFWDVERNAWFPKIDDEFMARYQMNYGFAVNTGLAPATTTSVIGNGVTNATGNYASSSANYYAAASATASSAANYYDGASTSAVSAAGGGFFSGSGSSTSAAAINYTYNMGPSTSAQAKRRRDMAEGHGQEQEQDVALSQVDADAETSKEEATSSSVEYTDDLAEFVDINAAAGFSAAIGAAAAAGCGGSGPSGAGKRRGPQEPPKWFDVDQRHNTKVYVSNLPSDITLDEFGELMAKCGMITRDPQTQKYKIKLYTDANGQIKGDGLCDYMKVESVDLALNILDEYMLRGHQLHVERAKFVMRGEYNPSLKPKRKKKDREKMQKMKERLFDWRPDKMRGERSKHEKVVIIKNLFDPSDFDECVELVLEYTNDMREECSKCGVVRKVTIYDRNIEGVVQVNMSTPEEADLVIQMMHGRFFGKRKLTAEHWDGRTKYKVNESAVEVKHRLSNWEDYLREFGDENDAMTAQNFFAGERERTNAVKELEAAAAANAENLNTGMDEGEMSGDVSGQEEDDVEDA